MVCAGMLAMIHGASFHLAPWYRRIGRVTLTPHLASLARTSARPGALPSVAELHCRPESAAPSPCRSIYSHQGSSARERIQRGATSGRRYASGTPAPLLETHPEPAPDLFASSPTRSDR